MPHRATVAVLSALTLLAGCHSKRDPEELRREGLERAQANLRDLASLQQLGNELQLQGKCTPAAVLAASDPDRQYLACFGASTGAGANPRLIEFRERYGSGAAGVARGCAEIQENEWAAVAATYCALDLERRVAEAKLLRPEYEKAKRCTNAAIREAADPDFHYLVCYGGLVSLTRYIDQNPRLNLFRDRYGPALEQVRSHCQELRLGGGAGRTGVGEGASPLVQFQTAYTVYCTD
jgi:hypothetical protein